MLETVKVTLEIGKKRFGMKVQYYPFDDTYDRDKVARLLGNRLVYTLQREMGVLPMQEEK